MAKQQPVFYDTADLVTIRKVTHARVDVFVLIDRNRGKVSLVEPDGNGGYKPKQWKFAEREIGYMQGWRNILKAMDLAVVDAQADLEAYQAKQAEKNTDAAVNAHLAAHPQLMKQPGNPVTEMRKLLKQGVEIQSVIMGCVGKVTGVDTNGWIEIKHRNHRPGTFKLDRKKHILCDTPDGWRLMTDELQD